MGIEHSKHIFRIFILLVLVVAGAFVGRILMVPETHGLYGHYRGASVLENARQEVRHGSSPRGADPEERNLFCTGCHVTREDGSSEDFHDDIWTIHQEGAHSSVPCEDCHDALATHVRDGEYAAEMAIIRNVDKLCARCHNELYARPDDFPQVNIHVHPVEMGAEEDTEEVCFECHSPHDPTP